MRHAHEVYREETRKGRLTRRECSQMLARIQPTLEYTGLRRCDVVIEAVVESLAIKHKVLREVEAVVPEGFIFATNTSSLPIDALALLDQIGVDVANHVAGVLSEAFRDRAPRSTALQILKDKGWLGRKTGQGFYLYPDGPDDGGAAGPVAGGDGPGARAHPPRRARRSEGPPRDVNEAVYGLISARPRHH